jgi:Tol biopolymer transport system component
MNADGSTPTRLTQTAAGECCLLWSPDGARLLFASDRDGNSELYLVDLARPEPIRLTTNTASDVPGDWRR